MKKRKSTVSFGAIAGILFIVAFVTCAVLFIVFIEMGKVTWGIVSWGCGAGVFVIALAGTAIERRLSQKRERLKNGNYILCKGKVLSCVLISGSDEDKNAYKIVFEAEGRRVTYYGICALCEGDIVDILLDKENELVMLP